MNHTANPIPTLTRLLIAVLLAFTTSYQATAQPDSSQPLVSLSAQTSSLAIRGRENILILTITVQEEWHTYWPGINDTGYGISIDIPPNEDLTFDEPFFPTPSRYIAPGNILDHIYDGTFEVLIPFVVSKEAEIGTMIPVGAFVSSLVCNDVCIPQNDGISLMLKVVGPDDINFTRQEAIDTLAKKPAKPTDASISWNDNEAKVSIPSATHYTFFPDNNCTQPADLITQGDTESDTLTITFDRQYEDDPTTPARLSGRLRAKINNAWREFDIDYTQPTPKETAP